MRENAWLQYDNGALDEATWISYRGAIRNMLGSLRTQTLWQIYVDRGTLDPEFTSMVNELLADAPLREGPVHEAFD